MFSIVHNHKYVFHSSQPHVYLYSSKDVFPCFTTAGLVPVLSAWSTATFHHEQPVCANDSLTTVSFLSMASQFKDAFKWLVTVTY